MQDAYGNNNYVLFKVNRSYVLTSYYYKLGTFLYLWFINTFV